jgi:hypothetical protein
MDPYPGGLKHISGSATLERSKSKIEGRRCCDSWGKGGEGVGANKTAAKSVGSQMVMGVRELEPNKTTAKSVGRPLI